MKLDLSIIVVTWNSERFINKCIDSIFTSLSSTKNERCIEIIVVDSGSTDNTSMVVSGYKDIQLINIKENIGYTRSINIGIRKSKGRHILLLNPDTELLDNVIDGVITYLDNNTDVGIAGVKTVNSDYTLQETKRRFPSVFIGIFLNRWSELIWIKKYIPTFILNNYYMMEINSDSIANVEWLQGSALFIRRSAFDNIGFLDTIFWMYYDDTDICRRAIQEGWSVRYIGTFSIMHHCGKSSEQVPHTRNYHYNRSKIIYFHKYHGVFVGSFVTLSITILHHITNLIAFMKHFCTSSSKY